MGKSVHLFSDSEAYHEQMGPIPMHLIWKLRYSLIQWAYLEPWRRTFQTVVATELASRSEINTELLVFAFISRLTR